MSDTFENFLAKIADSLAIPRVSRHIPYGAAYAASWCLELAWKLLDKKSRPLLTTYTVKNLGSKLRFSIEKAERVLGWLTAVGNEEGFRINHGMADGPANLGKLGN